MVGRWQRFMLALAGMAAAWLWAPAPARGQEIVLTGPLAGSCIATVRKDATPANWEWTYYDAVAVRLGDPAERSDVTPLVGLGGELTAGFLTYSGFPSGPYGYRLGKAELRIGSWAMATVGRGSARVEAGPTLKWGSLYHASWGTFGLRPGVGYGAFGSRAHGSLTLTYGVYSALGRYTRRGHCDPKPEPKPIALASVARLFVTVRRSFAKAELEEIVVGIELSPSFLFPPYNLFRLGGGPPHPIPWQTGSEP